MKWNEVGEMPCSVARALSVIGDRWTLLIIRNAFMRTRRFADFQQQLGISRHRLADRLSRLVDQGIFVKTAYQDKPVRYEYRLTDKGKDLYPVLQTLTAWGDKWMDQGQGAPLQYYHKSCGQLFTPTVACSACGEPIDAKEVIAVPGPGLATG